MDHYRSCIVIFSMKTILVRSHRLRSKMSFRSLPAGGRPQNKSRTRPLQPTEIVRRSLIDSVAKDRTRKMCRTAVAGNDLTGAIHKRGPTRMTRTLGSGTAQAVRLRRVIRGDRAACAAPLLMNTV